MADEGRTHYVGDSCPGGHADVAHRLGLVATEKPEDDREPSDG